MIPLMWSTVSELGRNLILDRFLTKIVDSLLKHSYSKFMPKRHKITTGSFKQHQTLKVIFFVSLTPKNNSSYNLPSRNVSQEVSQLEFAP